MPDKQFEDYRRRKQDIAENKPTKTQINKQTLAQAYIKKRINEKRAKKQPIKQK